MSSVANMTDQQIALIRSMTPVAIVAIIAIVVLALMGVDVIGAIVVPIGGIALKYLALNREANGSTIAGRIQGVPRAPTYHDPDHPAVKGEG